MCYDLDLVFILQYHVPTSDVKWLWVGEIGVGEYWVVQVTSSALIGC